MKPNFRVKYREQYYGKIKYIQYALDLSSLKWYDIRKYLWRGWHTVWVFKHEPSELPPDCDDHYYGLQEGDIDLSKCEWYYDLLDAIREHDRMELCKYNNIKYGRLEG